VIRALAAQEPARASVVGAIVVVLLVSDFAYQHAGSSILLGGPLDETAHLMTGALVLQALPRGRSNRFCVAVLVASVLIDIDHVPGALGIDWITRGTPRPYTHSIAMVALLGLAAVAWSRHRQVLLGSVVGVGVHLWRDLAESNAGVSLFWPFSDYPVTAPHWCYLLSMGLLASIALQQAWTTRCLSARALPHLGDH
jgi:membrane-bound metal-dependent hydrolase YbcI (DUF457 family)